MLVFEGHVIEELRLVELYDIKDLLGLLQLLANFQVLHTSIGLQFCLCRGYVLLQDGHAFITLAHRNQEVSVEGLALTWDAEDELVHLCDKLGVRNTTSAPAMHAKVAL